MMFYTFSIISVLTFGLCTAEKLPVFMATCKRGSDDYSACLTKAAQEAWPQFVKGLPEYDRSSLDPYSYKYQNIIVNAELIRANLTAYNLTIFGMNNTKFLDARTHLDNHRFRLEVDLLMPKIKIEGHCLAEGSLGGFRLSGNAYFVITMEDVKSWWKFTGHVKDDTFNLTHFRTFPEIGNMSVYAENLFEGSKELSDLAVQFANEYWPALYRMMLPEFAKGWNAILTEELNPFFAHFSFKELFP